MYRARCSITNHDPKLSFLGKSNEDIKHFVAPCNVVMSERLAKCVSTSRCLKWKLAIPFCFVFIIFLTRLLID